MLRPYLAAWPKVLQLEGARPELLVAFPRFEEVVLAQLAAGMEFLFPFEEQNLEEKGLLLH